MTDKTRVYLITGFLGSGKTTFLNQIIKAVPPGRKLTIMINEFGEMGVDGALVEGEALDIMEISKGSIFCACIKTDFIKGLYELYQTTRPDILLIEPTGVANPKDLKKDLELPIFNNRFDYREQFCLIDGAHFFDAYRTFASLEKQIASSNIFIVNKTDLAKPEDIARIKETIRGINPHPVFYETTYAQIPFQDFFQWAESRSLAAQGTDSSAPFISGLSDDQLDLFINKLLGSPHFEISPPDRLMSMALRWEGTRLEQIKYLAQNLPSTVVRAKGLLEIAGRLHLFNYVMGDWTITTADLSQNPDKQKNVVVLIGPPEAMGEISRVAPPDIWTALGTYQPEA